jgi:transcriptional adapter 2-alpha
MTIVECYAWRLRERAKARKFVVERQLHDQKFQDKLTKNRDAETKEVHKQFKRFFQVMNKDEYDDFLKGLALEKQMQHRIIQLQNYRKKGITTLAEAKRYEEEKARRDEEKRKEKNSVYSNRKAKKMPLDLTGQAGVDMLTKQERKLCEDFHMLPNQYLLAKEALMREYVNSSDLNLVRDRVRSLVDMEASKIDKVFTFLFQVGWINNRAHRGQPDAVQSPGSVKPQVSGAQVSPNQMQRTPVPTQPQPQYANSASKKRGRD